jgi:hypothetical protein
MCLQWGEVTLSFKVMNVFSVSIIKCCFTLKVEVMFVHLSFVYNQNPKPCDLTLNHPHNQTNLKCEMD